MESVVRYFCRHRRRRRNNIRVGVYNSKQSRSGCGVDVVL